MEKDLGDLRIFNLSRRCRFRWLGFPSRGRISLKSDGSFSKRGGPRDPKGYRGIIRGLYRAPLRDYIGVILKNTQIPGGQLLVAHPKPRFLPHAICQIRAIPEPQILDCCSYVIHINIYHILGPQRIAHMGTTMGPGPIIPI